MTKSNATTLIATARAAADLSLRAPKAGESVHFGFKTDGNGKRIKKGSEIPFDKIVALYEGRDQDGNGKPLFTVQVTSGDVVQVANVGKSAWEAVA